MKIFKLLSQIDISPNELDIPQPGDPTSATVSDVLQIVFGVAGVLAALIITIAGFQYITSRGEPQATKKARDAIIYAGVGLVISVLAFSIVSFVVGEVG